MMSRGLHHHLGTASPEKCTTLLGLHLLVMLNTLPPTTPEQAIHTPRAHIVWVKQKLRESAGAGGLEIWVDEVVE